MNRLKVSAFLICCTAAFCVHAVPTFGNEYVHIKLHVPKPAAANAHDNLHKLEDVARSKHHGTTSAHNVIHHHHHHHHRPQTQLSHSHGSRHVHRRPTSSRPHFSSHHNAHQHHHDHDHEILDTVLVSELKDISNIASGHLDYISHAGDIAHHVSQIPTLPTHKAKQFVETYKIIEEKKPPSSYRHHSHGPSDLDTYRVIDTTRIPTIPPHVDTVKIIENVESHHPQHHHHQQHQHQPNYEHYRQTSSSQTHYPQHSQHHEHYHTINAAAVATVTDHHDHSPPSQQHSYPTHYPSQAPQQLSDSYGPAPAQITALEEVLDSYQPPHYSELKAPSPRPVYGVPTPIYTSTTTTKQPFYPTYARSKPTYSSYHQSTHTYVPPPPAPSAPPSSHHYEQSHLDYQGYDQGLSHYAATQEFKPSIPYKGYEDTEGSDLQQLSDGYLPSDTLIPPAGNDDFSSNNAYVNAYEDQTLAGVGEAEDGAVWPESTGGFHASETYVGIDSYSAAHVQGVGSGGYAYGGPYP